MEYLGGVSLEQRLRAGGPLPWREVVEIGLQVAEALAGLHAAGVIHRDVKPANIVLLEATSARPALAVQASGTVAVCGTAPTQGLDGLDAAVWFFESGEPGVPRALDYSVDPDLVQPHSIAETVRDCIFSGDRLVLVGEAFGEHVDAQKIEYERHFVLEYEVATEVEAWRVATGTVAMQSGATAVTLDGEGNYVTAGYVCGPTCDPAAELWIVAPEDGLVWRTPLGGREGAPDIVNQPCRARGVSISQDTPRIHPAIHAPRHSSKLA